MDFAVFILGRPCNSASLNSAITEGPTPQVPGTELVRAEFLSHLLKQSLVAVPRRPCLQADRHCAPGLPVGQGSHT